MLVTSPLEMSCPIEGTRDRPFARLISGLNKDALRVNCGYFPTRSRSLARDRPLHTSLLYRLPVITLYYYRLRTMGYVSSKIATASRASPRNDAIVARHRMSILPYIADSTTEGSRGTISAHPLSCLPCLDNHSPTTAGARYRSNRKSPEEIECASRSQHAR